MMAKVILAIPDPSERVFSKLGWIYTKERLSMPEDENVVSLYVTSDKNILYARRLVVYRNQRRWWCKKQGNKDCD